MLRLFALCLIVSIAGGVASAATLPATPATLASVLRTARGGDVVALKGQFPGLALQELTFATPLMIDATGATMTKLTYARNLRGVTFKGGTWRQGLRIDGGERIKIVGGKWVGPADANTFAGLHLNWLTDVEVLNVEISHMIGGMILTGVDGFRIEGNHLHELRSDGIDLAGCRNGRVAGNTILNPSPKEGDHPDGIQILQAGAKYPVENIVIEDNVIAGRMQGIFGGNGPYRNLTVRGNRISAGYVNGIGIGDVDGLVLEDNEVSSLPGSPWQAVIGAGNSKNVIFRGRNVAQAYKDSPARVLSKAPKTVAPKRAAELEVLSRRLDAALKSLPQ